MRALVVYGTTEGHTRKIAEWVSHWLRNHHFAVLTVDSALVPDDFNAGGFDVYILAGSLHIGKHQASLVKFAKKNQDILSSSPSALISASATASRTDADSLAKANACIDEFTKETGWVPTVTKPIGGAMLYTKYNFLLRWVLKRISEKEGGPTDTSKDYEFTDWKALENFLSDFLWHQGTVKDLDHALLKTQ